MTIEPDFDDDFAVFDGAQEVLPVVEGDPSSTPLSGLKRPLSLREIEASGGVYQVGDVRWHFDAAVTALPAVDDVFAEADGTQWTVVEVRSAVLGSRASCVARRVATP